jgi:hypothetical protein
MASAGSLSSDSPYSLLYVVESERVFILELVYQKQEPAYWTDDEG